MTRFPRTSCPGWRPLVLAGFAVVALAVPSHAAIAAPASADSAVTRPSGGTPGHQRPPVPDRDPHDFGWQ